MAHTFTSWGLNDEGEKEETLFISDGGIRGEVAIYHRSTGVTVPMEALWDFLADKIVSHRISQMEQADWWEVLGLPAPPDKEVTADVTQNADLDPVKKAAPLND